MPALLHRNLQTRILDDQARMELLLSDAPPDAFDLPRGTRLNNGAFVLEEVLGRGGFGITYRARDCRSQRTVAIKEYFPSGCVRVGVRVQSCGASRDTNKHDGVAATRFADGKRQFLDEARVLIGLRHPNIVRVQSSFEDHATAYLVMEFLEGQTLLERVDQNGALLPDEALALIEKVALALDAVHRLGMLHLDIKPENVFLCSRNNAQADTTTASEPNTARRVVLMDFDLMRRMEGAATYQTRPLSHTFGCGTPGYAPLEQYTQGARFDRHTDIYALGATLFHLLTGHAPPSAPDRAHRESMQGVAPAPDILRQMPTPIRQAILWAMQARPERRPQAVREFLDALDGKTIPPHASPRMSTHVKATATGALVMPSLAVPSLAIPSLAIPSLVAPLPLAAPANASSANTSAFAHSVPHTGITSGEWHHVRLATTECEWPLFCACCGAPGEGFFSVAPSSKANRGAGNGPTWQVPYCLTCLRHVGAAKNAVAVAMIGMGCGLCLAALSIATSNIYTGSLGVFVHFTAMAYWVLKYVFAEQTATPQCCDAGIAVGCVATGQTTQWKFKNRDYASAFRQLNAACVI